MHSVVGEPVTYPLKHPWNQAPSDEIEGVTGQQYLDADLAPGQELKAGCPLCDRTGVRRSQVEEGMPRDHQDMIREHGLSLDTCYECGGSGRLLLTGFSEREISQVVVIGSIVAGAVISAGAIALGWALTAFVLLPASIAWPFVFRAAERTRVEQLSAYQKRDKELLGQGMVSWKRHEIIEQELDQEDDQSDDTPTPSLAPERKPKSPKQPKPEREKKKPQAARFGRLHPTLLVALIVVSYLLFRDLQTLGQGDLFGSAGEIPWGLLLLGSFFYLRAINR